MLHGLSFPSTCGILLDQGLNPRLLHWQADSLPLSHQGSLLAVIVVVITVSWARIAQLDPSDKYEESFLCGWRWVWAFHMGLTLALCGILLLTLCSVPLSQGPCPPRAAATPGEEPGWGSGALRSSPSFVTSLVTLGSLLPFQGLGPVPGCAGARRTC